MTKVRHQSTLTKKNSNAHSGRALKLALLAGASITSSTILSAAFAQDVTISDDLTTPVTTSTANNGSAGNVTISNNGSITLNSGTAITVNSSNNLNLQGNVKIEASDDSIGVHLMGGNTGNYTQSGSIVLDATEEQRKTLTDTEDAVDLNDNRVGLLISGASPFVGDITTASTSTITVYGDQSAGFAVRGGGLTGDIDFNSRVIVEGDNSQAVDISSTVNGDVVFGSNANLAAAGIGTSAIRVTNNEGSSIQGAFVFGGRAQATGYTDLTKDAEKLPNGTDNPDNNNEFQEGRQGGAAISIGANVTGGVLIQGPIPNGQLKEAAQGQDPITQPGAANVSSFGSAPAIYIGNGATLGDVANTLIKDPAVYGTYGFINRGAVVGRGVYDGINSLGVHIDNATIASGIRNDGSISSLGSNGSSTALRINGGSTVGGLVNTGRIEATTAGTTSNSEEGVYNATALHIAGSSTSLPSVDNRGIIGVAVASDNGTATAVLDETGTLTNFSNTGTVAARILDDTSKDGRPTNEGVAFDFSANTSGVTINNTVKADFDADKDKREDSGIVVGNVLFGSGNDTFSSDAGKTEGDINFADGNDTLNLSKKTTLTGDVNFGSGNDSAVLNDARITGNLSFGGGNDTLSISNGSIFTGRISNSDNLDVTVASNSSLNINSINPFNLTNLNVDGTSVLGFAIQDGNDVTAGNSPVTTLLNVAGTASFATGATINPIFLGAVPSGSFSSTIVSAATLNANVADLKIGDSDGNTPFLFNFELSRNGNNLVLDVARKAASDLGIAASLESAINPTIAALNRDLGLGVQIFNLKTQQEFQSAFGQLIAGPLDAPLTYARAQTNSVTSIITQRLDMARNSGDYGRTFWLQEEGYFVNRDDDAESNGFDGGGFAVAAGVDIGWNEYIDAVGLSATFSSARYDEQSGEDYPFDRITYGLGAYGAASFSGFKVDARGEYAISKSESERNVSIGSVRRKALGEWDGTQISASSRISYEGGFGDISVEPFVGIDYVKLEEDAYTETGGGADTNNDGVIDNEGINLRVADREAESIRTNLGVKVGKVFQLKPNVYDTGIPGTIHPQFTLAWSQELKDDPIAATYTYASGGDSFTLFSDPEDGAAIIGADIAYENEYAKIHVGTSGTFGDKTETFILRAGVGLKW